MPIEIVNLQKLVGVPSKEVRRALRRVMREELGREVGVSVAVVTDERIAEVNKAFLNHDGPTDVIAFSLGEGAAVCGHEEVFGEIVISAGRARVEAKKRKIAPERELLLYAVHGMLHLAGYDDHTAAQRKEMRRRERDILKGLESAKRSGGKP